MSNSYKFALSPSSWKLVLASLSLSSYSSWILSFSSRSLIFWWAVSNSYVNMVTISCLTAISFSFRSAHWEPRLLNCFMSRVYVASSIVQIFGFFLCILYFRKFGSFYWACNLLFSLSDIDGFILRIFLMMPVEESGRIAAYYSGASPAWRASGAGSQPSFSVEFLRLGISYIYSTCSFWFTELFSSCKLEWFA